MLQRFMFLVLVIASAVANKTEDCSSFTGLGKIPAWNDFTQLIQSELRFTADLCRRIGMRRSSDNLNVVFTPFNIYNGLLFMYFMSGNTTEEIIGQLFHIPKNQTKSSIHAIYNTLTLHKKSSSGVRSIRTLTKPKKTNSRQPYIKEDFCIFLSDNFKVKSCAWKFFERNIQLVDFTKPVETVQKVNEWVSNQTGYAENSIHKTDFDNYTNMLFANTALFHGVWKQPFSLLKPKQEFRMINGTTLNVTMMVQTGQFKKWFDKDLNVDILEVPYEGDVHKVLILLPRKESPSAVGQLLMSLSQTKLSYIINNQAHVNESIVTIEIPKFKIEKTYDLVRTMTYLGFNKIFDSPIDLSNILEQSSENKITKFRVKAVYTVKIEFDEVKTKASAVIASSSKKSYEKYSAKPKPSVFRADHPFVYFVYMSNNLIVLGGVLYYP